MKILEKLDLKELIQLQEMFSMNNDVILDEIKKRKQFSESALQYSVFYKKNQFLNRTSIEQEQCNQILSQLKIEDIEFFYKNLFHEPGNNKNGSLSPHKLFFYSEEVQQIIKDFHYPNDYFIFMKTKGLYSICNNPKVMNILKKSEYLIYLDNFFNKDENILGYEGAFNTYLFLKNSIYNSIDEKQDVKQNFETLFINFSEKQSFIKEHFSEIADFLLYERNNIFNARLSVYNNGLSRGVRKKQILKLHIHNKILLMQLPLDAL